MPNRIVESLYKVSGIQLNEANEVTVSNKNQENDSLPIRISDSARRLSKQSFDTSLDKIKKIIMKALNKANMPKEWIERIIYNPLNDTIIVETRSPKLGFNIEIINDIGQDIKLYDLFKYIIDKEN